MLKKILLFSLIAIVFSACDKNPVKSTGCQSQVCTDLFASVGIKFVDANGNGLPAITNFTVLDTRTNQQLHPTSIPEPCCGIFTVISDSEKNQLSTTGDDLKVSATDPKTNITETATVKVSGGCNCHVQKIAGPDSVVFK